MDTNKKKQSVPKLIISVIISLLLIIVVVIISSDKKKPYTTENNKREFDSIGAAQLIVVETQIEETRPNFTENYDEFNKITWIYPKDFPKYANTMAFYTYLGLSDDGSIVKRLFIRYHGNEWLFMQNIKIKTDDHIYTIDARNSDRDNNTDVWEWIDIIPSASDDAIIEKIINSKTTKIRFEGKHHHFDWTLPAVNITCLKEINKYYELLKKRKAKIDYNKSNQ